MNAESKLEQAAEQYAKKQYEEDMNSSWGCDYNGFMAGAKSEAAKEYILFDFMSFLRRNKKDIFNQSDEVIISSYMEKESLTTPASNVKYSELDLVYAQLGILVRLRSKLGREEILENGKWITIDEKRELLSEKIQELTKLAPPKPHTVDEEAKSLKVIEQDDTTPMDNILSVEEGQTQEPVGEFKVAIELSVLDKLGNYIRNELMFIDGSGRRPDDGLNRAYHNVIEAIEHYKETIPKSPPPAPIKTEGEDERKVKEDIAKIIRDNIFFSGQVGGYVIHGAIEKIIEYFITHSFVNMRWVKASEKILGSEKTAIVRWYEHGEFQRIDLMDGHTLYDWASKNKKDLDCIEWLDENYTPPPSPVGIDVEALAMEKYPVQMDAIHLDGDTIEYDYNEELREAFKAGYAASLPQSSTEEEKELIIQGLEEGSELWKAEYDNCRSILTELVYLKNLKDSAGKTEEYEQRQPLVWITAKKFLEKYQHQ